MSQTYTVTVVEEHNADQALTVTAAKQLCNALADIASNLSVPPFDLTVVLSGDLTASINEHGEAGFQPERLGGMVAGKTLPATADHAAMTIVLDAATPPEDVPPFWATLSRIHILAHEYGHAMIGRLRAVAGTKPAAPTTRMQTPSEAAAVIAYRSAEEFQCDWLAHAVLQTVGFGTDGSNPVKLADLGLGTMIGDGYREHLAEVVDTMVHPGWPELVDAYRHRRIDLVTMFSRLVRETEQVMTLVAHADAVAQASSNAPVLNALAGHRGVDLYLAQAWEPVRKVLDEVPGPPCADDFATVDQDLQTAGEGLVEMWSRLGVRGHVTDDGQLYLTVSEPQR